MRTVRVPVSSPKASPARVVSATDVPLRALIRNNAAATVVLAYSINDISPAVTSESFRLAASEERAFVFAPGQALFAVALGIVGRVSVAASDAFPTVP